jgi:hypothetical protein
MQLQATLDISGNPSNGSSVRNTDKLDNLKGTPSDDSFLLISQSKYSNGCNYEEKRRRRNREEYILET